MQGRYLKPDGNQVEVLQYDPINKMVEVKIERGEQQWYHEPEYSLWESLDPIEEGEVDDIEEEKTEPVKKKKESKKKTK